MKTTLCHTVDCGRHFRQRDRGRKRYCKRCREKRAAKDLKAHANRRMVRYYNWLDRGLCPECGGFRDVPGQIQCKSCRAKNRKAQQVGKTKERTNRYQRRLMKGRRAAGMCPYCGRKIDEEGYRMCSKCRKRNRDRYYLPEVHKKVRKYAADHYLETHKPKAICRVCHLHHCVCDLCYKFMKAQHGRESCLWICKCGYVRYYKKERKKHEKSS